MPADYLASLSSYICANANEELCRQRRARSVQRVAVGARVLRARACVHAHTRRHMCVRALVCVCACVRLGAAYSCAALARSHLRQVARCSQLALVRVRIKIWRPNRWLASIGQENRRTHAYSPALGTGHEIHLEAMSAAEFGAAEQQHVVGPS